MNCWKTIVNDLPVTFFPLTGMYASLGMKEEHLNHFLPLWKRRGSIVVHDDHKIVVMNFILIKESDEIPYGFGSRVDMPSSANIIY